MGSLFVYARLLSFLNLVKRLQIPQCTAPQCPDVVLERPPMEINLLMFSEHGGSRLILRTIDLSRDRRNHETAHQTSTGTIMALFASVVQTLLYRKNGILLPHQSQHYTRKPLLEVAPTILVRKELDEHGNYSC